MRLQLLGRGPNDHPALYLAPSAIAGMGVFGAWAVEKGVYEAHFDGPFYQAVRDEDLPEELRGLPMQINATQMRGSTGLAVRYNHSCEPNCGFGWNEDLGCYSIRPLYRIPGGVEHTIDYAMCQWDDDVTLYPHGPCNCQTRVCRHTILGCKSLPDYRVRIYQANQAITAYNLEMLRRVRAL